MKFSYAIGNPPYQDTLGQTEQQTQGNSKWIYPNFIELADIIAEKSCLIYPFGGWFDNISAFNGLGRRLLSDGHTVFIKAYEGTADKRAWYRTDKEPEPIFGYNANLSAGVSIVMRDMSKLHNTFKYSNRMYSDIQADISILDVDSLVPNQLFASISKKLTGKKLFDDIKLGIFGIESNFVELNPDKVSLNKTDWKDPIQLLTNDKAGSSGRAKLYWTDKSNISKGIDYIDLYKVITVSAYPKKTFVSGKPTLENVKKRAKKLIDILEPGSAFGRSRLLLYASKSLDECNNYIKYTQTNFFAGLLLQEPNRCSSFGYIIPAQDYSNKSDIDWSKSLDEIDKQLYTKYNLTQEEINFIEQSVKNME